MFETTTRGVAKLGRGRCGLSITVGCPPADDACGPRPSCQDRRRRSQRAPPRSSQAIDEVGCGGRAPYYTPFGCFAGVGRRRGGATARPSGTAEHGSGRLTGEYASTLTRLHPARHGTSGLPRAPQQGQARVRLSAARNHTSAGGGRKVGLGESRLGLARQGPGTGRAGGEERMLS